MSSLKRLIQEIHRRSLWQVLAIYLAGAAIGYQFVQSLTEGLGLPDWFPAFALVLFIIGLPIVIATAVVHEPQQKADLDTESPPSDLEAQRTEAPARARSRGVRRLFTWRNAMLGGLLAAGLWGVVATGWLLFGDRLAGGGERKLVLVLPFENLGLPEDDFFAEGITEEITSRLAGVSEVGVIGRTTAHRYKKTDKTIKQIGAELGVDYVLEGTVRWQRTPDGTSRVRVTPQLVQVVDETYMWSDRYDAVLADIFEVQSDIAAQVVRALDVTLLAGDRRVIESKPTENLAAYEEYLRGNESLNRGVAEQALLTAVEYYKTAVELDPTFALAYAKLSEAHVQLYWQYYDRSEERLTKAKESVDTAMRLQPELPEARVVVALLEQLGG